MPECPSDYWYYHALLKRHYLMAKDRLMALSSSEDALARGPCTVAISVSLQPNSTRYKESALNYRPMCLTYRVKFYPI